MQIIGQEIAKKPHRYKFIIVIIYRALKIICQWETSSFPGDRASESEQVYWAGSSLLGKWIKTIFSAFEIPLEANVTEKK